MGCLFPTIRVADCDNRPPDQGLAKGFEPALCYYRLRVGDWRVLFEVDGKAIVVHEVKHRSEAYD